MNGYEYFLVGDKVTIDKPGNSGLAPGTVVTIGSFGFVAYGHLNRLGIPPGFYENKHDVLVQTETGAMHSFAGGNLSFAQTSLLDKREAEHEKRLQETGQDNLFFLGFPARVADLPKVTFWEGDEVRIKKARPGRNMNTLGRTFIVREIRYADYLNGRRDLVYSLSEEWESKGSYFPVDENELELVNKGPIRNLYDRQKISFRSPKELSAFMTAFGITDLELIPNTGQGIDFMATLHMKLPYHL